MATDTGLISDPATNHLCRPAWVSAVGVSGCGYPGYPLEQNRQPRLALLKGKVALIAGVAGMDQQALARDQDFVWAVQSIVQACKVNVDTAKINC